MNTGNRLSAVAPDLVVLGESLSARQRKTVACRVAEWACRMTDAVTFLGERRVLGLLNAGHSATPEERGQLAEDIEDLDEKYFVAAEQSDGMGDAGAAMQWFSKARAAAAVFYALDSSTPLGFCEALYEAQAATGNLDGLRALCRGAS